MNSSELTLGSIRLESGRESHDSTQEGPGPSQRRTRPFVIRTVLKMRPALRSGMVIESFRPYTLDRPISTERLTLRLMTPADLDDVYAYQSRDDVCRYLLYEPRTRDEVAGKLAEFAAATTLAKDGDYLQLALELPGQNGEPARVIGDSYFTIASVEHSRGEIGWTMHPDYTGRGYAAEAASAMLGVAFEDLRLHRVFAELDPRNDASVELCLRLGMRHEAHLVKDMMFKGEWADSGVYAILRDEWLARQG